MNISDIVSRTDISRFLNARGLTGVGVEVGVLRGEFSRAVLKEWKGKKLYLVDAWRNFKENTDMNNGDHNTQLNNLAETFKNVYQFFDRATIIRETSVEASELFPDNFFDFVYLDAAHDYKNVMKDLEAWFPKLKKGGLFCGDDYHDGVILSGGVTLFESKTAVDEFAAKNNLEVVTTRIPSNIEMPQWWCIK